MKRHLRVYGTFFRSSFVRELEFRANFIAKILQNFAWVFFFVMVLVVIYGNTDSVVGWSRGDAFVLSGACYFMTATCYGCFMSLHEIPQQVRLGTLDFVMTKPVDSQFWVSTRRFNFDQIGAFVAALGMIGYGVVTSNIQPSFGQWAAFLVLIVCAIVLFYSFSLAMMTLGIYFVRVDNLWALAETVGWVARYPTDVYGSALHRVFTYALPLTFLAMAPAWQLTHELRLEWVGLGIFWAGIGFLGARKFWRHSLQSYTSASS